MSGDGFLTVEELAERLRVKVSWVYSNAKRLGGFRLGKYWRFTWERVQERLIQGETQLGNQPKDQT